MFRVRRTALVAAALLGSAVTAGCSSEVGSTGEAGYISGKGVVTTLPVSQREEPGQVSGETLEGEQVALADFEGKVVVVNVWGSWCPPCRAEADDLAAAARQLPDDRVAFLGINNRDHSLAAAQAFQRKFDVPYPSIYDPAGETLLSFYGTLTPNSIPSTVLIDEQGRVAASVLGEITKSTLLGLVEEVSTGDR